MSVISKSPRGLLLLAMLAAPVSGSLSAQELEPSDGEIIGTVTDEYSPPAAAMRRLSITSWRMRRTRPAPIASLSAISRERAGARLLRRPATFAHATHRTSSASVTNIAAMTANCGRALTRASNSV